MSQTLEQCAKEMDQKAHEILFREYEQLTAGEPIEAFCQRMLNTHSISVGHAKRWIVEHADKQVRALLNYGGFRVVGSPTNPTFMMDWKPGDRADEVGHMRALSKAFDTLANAVEAAGD